MLAPAVAFRVGNRLAPATRTAASAWRTRAMAAAMSKLPVSAAAISRSSSGDRKPRHQSWVGHAARAEIGVARNAAGISRAGRL